MASATESYQRFGLLFILDRFHRFRLDPYELVAADSHFFVGNHK